MRPFTATILMICVLMCTTATASASKRVALIVGNANYAADVGRLANPVNDAFAMKTKFEQAGYVVVYVTDATKSAFDAALVKFERELRGAELGLFFFAGHGLQVESQNWLLMTNAARSRAKLLDEYAINLDAVQRLIEDRATVAVLLADACRNNPFMGGSVRIAKADGSSRSANVGQGLASVRNTVNASQPGNARPVNSIVAFSASAGRLAADSDGSINSPFASAILRHLFAPRQDVRILLARASQDVIATTRGAQQPQVFSQLASVVSLVDAVPVIPKPPRLPKGQVFYGRATSYGDSLAASSRRLPVSGLPKGDCRVYGANTLSGVADLDWFEPRTVTTRVEALMATKTVGADSGNEPGTRIELEGASASQFHHDASIIGEVHVGAQRLRVLFGTSFAYGFRGIGGPERAVSLIEYVRDQSGWEISSAGWGVSVLTSSVKSDGDPRIIWVDKNNYAVEFPAAQRISRSRQERVFLYFVPMSGCYKTFETRTRAEFMKQVRHWLRSG